MLVELLIGEIHLPAFRHGQRWCSWCPGVGESGSVSQRGEEGLMAALKFETQLDLLMCCDGHEVAVLTPA